MKAKIPQEAGAGDKQQRERVIIGWSCKKIGQSIYS
jgi:hypothetical protein